MNKYLLSLLTTLVCINSLFAQKIADSAITALQQGDYKSADSLYTELLVVRNELIMPILSDHGNSFTDPVKDWYYNKAIANLFLGDTATFCQEMFNSAECIDTAAYAYYCEVCLGQVIDTTYLDKHLNKTGKEKFQYRQITYFDKYRNLIFGEIRNTKRKTKEAYYSLRPGHVVSYSLDLVGKFIVKGADTLYYFTDDKLTSSDYGINIDRLRKELSFLISNPEPKEIAYAKYKRNKIVIILTLNFDLNGKYSSLGVFSMYPKVVDEIYVNEAKLVTKLALQNWDYTGKILGRKVLTEDYIRIEFGLTQ